VPTKGNKGGSVYINAHVNSLYPAEVVEAALSKPGALEVMTTPNEIARFCLQATHIEKCYCFKVRNKEHDEILPLELFRLITSSGRTLTVGQVEVMTRIYQDMFRCSGQGTGRKLYNMGGIATYKFPRSISLTILRAVPNDPMTEDLHDPRCLTQIVVRRAICIWKLIVKYQNRTGDSIQLSVLDLPEEA